MMAQLQREVYDPNAGYPISQANDYRIARSIKLPDTVPTSAGGLNKTSESSRSLDLFYIPSAVANPNPQTSTSRFANATRTPPSHTKRSSSPTQIPSNTASNPSATKKDSPTVP